MTRSSKPRSDYDVSNPDFSDIELDMEWFCTIALSVSTEAEVEMKVYPNPASEELRITGVRQGTPISIIDITGKAWSSTVVKDRLSISHLPSGIYFLLTERGGIKFIKK